MVGVEYYIAHEQEAGLPTISPVVVFAGVDTQNRAMEFIMQWGQRLYQEEYHDAPQLIKISSVHTELTGQGLNPLTIDVPKNE